MPRAGSGKKIDELWMYSTETRDGVVIGGAWERQLELHPAPGVSAPALDGHGMAAVGQDLYINAASCTDDLAADTGLCGSATAAKGLWKYSTVTHEFMQISNSSFGGKTVSIGSDLYAWDGSDLQRFSTETLTWSPVETVPGEAKPSARTNHAMAVVGDNIFMHGGKRPPMESVLSVPNLNQSSEFQKLHDPSKCRMNHKTIHVDPSCCGCPFQTWCADGYLKVHGAGPFMFWSQSWPNGFGYVCIPPTDRHGAKEKLVMSALCGAYIDDLWKYSKSSASWEFQMMGIMQGREGHVMVAVGADLYLHGGFTTSKIPAIQLNDLWRYSTLSASWQRISGIDGGVRPSGRSFHVMVAVGSELYLHGGWTHEAWLDSISARAPQSSDELWKYSVERASWELLRSQDGASKPSARYRHAMEVVGAELYLHGGFDWRTIPTGE